MAGRIDARAIATCSDSAFMDHRVDAVPAMRKQLRERLVPTGLSLAVREDVELIATELLTNAVRHARDVAGRVELEVSVTPQQVHVRVTDGGSDQQLVLRDHNPAHSNGRGLHIVERLCADWGVADHEDGRRTVWAQLAVRPT